MKWTKEQIAKAQKNLSPQEIAELSAHVFQASREPPADLMNFIPWLSPKFKAPHHLKPLIDALERSKTEPLRLLVSVAPRSGKTESLLHSIAWILKNDPTEQIAYITHTDRLARMKSGKARQLTEAAGLVLSNDSNSKSDWRTGHEEGGLWATSVGGSIVGLGFTKMFIDDPHKGRAEVESAIQREADWEWFNGVAFNRLEPEGSIIVNAARWHPDDMIGRLVKEGWEYINLPAISPSGEALWPEQWPIERLMEIKAKSEYDWQSLYLGDPRLRTTQVFESSKTYLQLPPALKIAIGVDCAYSAKTKSDFSVAIVMGEHDGTWYILDIIHKQCKLPEFAEDLKNLQMKYPAAFMRWDCSTTEMGTADLLRHMGVKKLYGNLAKGDAFLRAQPVAAKWNAGKVLVPQQAAWLETFLESMKSFTGLGDLHDDLQASLASCFALLPANPIPAKLVEGTEEWFKREAESAMQHRMNQNKQTRQSPWGNRR